MLFNKENYPAIKEACEQRHEFEFEARKEDTSFESSTVEVPSRWTALSPGTHAPEGYAQIFAQSSNDARGHLTRLELLINLDGGRVFFKSTGENMVAVKVTWPAAAAAE